ncbi:MAG: VPS10 domain-containing protein, partial [Chthoniobacterales bacterium]
NDPSAEVKPRGVIYALAPSVLNANRIWAGTDDGLIYLTSDSGKHWNDVTPPQITAWQKISIIDAGHFDAGTAYAAVNTLRLDDVRPHIYRTHDSGKTWQEIARGIPNGETVNVVREDTQRKGLLFAGTERAVYYSLDDGDNWQSLRLNMPATSVRDLILKDDDIAVATHGRGFWILDNITPLRQIDLTSGDAILFKAQTAMRVRWNTNTDTPLPPDEPVGENPPDGAMIDYFLAKDSASAVTLEIKDAKGNLVRRYASDDVLREPDQKKLRVPAYWVRPNQPLSNKAGMHRFLWDLHYTPLPNIQPEFPMTAIFRDTPAQATSPWALPGNYSLVLTADGKSFTQPLSVKMDPRVKASVADLAQQFELSKKLCELRATLEPIGKTFEALNDAVTKAKEQAEQKPIKEQLEAFAKKLREFSPANQRPGAPPSFDLLDKAQQLFGTVQHVDAAPTPRVRTAVAEVLTASPAIVQRWKTFISQEIPALNQALEKAGLEKLEIRE